MDFYNNNTASTATTTPTNTSHYDDDDDDDGSPSRSHWGVARAILSNLLLFFLILGLSATVDTKGMRQRLQNKFAIVTGVGMQFLLMPLLGYLAVLVTSHYGLAEAIGITLLVVTSSPGGSYANWWCSLFNADLALSVAMTTCSSVMSIALLPLNLFCYTYLAYGTKTNENGESIIQALNFETIFISLGVVLSAIVLGFYVGYRYDSKLAHERANRLASVCGLSLIIFSLVIGNSGGDSSTKLWNHHWTLYVATAAPCIGGLVLAVLTARTVKLSPPETVSIGIECCYRNTGIATSVAITMFSKPEERAQAVAVPLFYGIVEAIVVVVFGLYAWKIGWTKAPPNENLCTIMSKTYQDIPNADSSVTEENRNGAAAEEVDINLDNNVEDGLLPAVSQQRHPGLFSQVLFGRRRPLAQDSSDQASPRKRIVSDFTADTILTSPPDSCHGVPVQTIIEGGCEPLDHIELDELDDEESQVTANDLVQESEDTVPHIQSEESKA